MSAAEPVEAPRLPGLGVLVVDDEPDVRRGLRLLISKLGCRVETAADGAEALERCAQAPPDVVISDVRMPGLSGPDLLRRILERRPETAVVMLTGYGTVELAVSCLQAGAAHFLSKPFDNDEVLTLVERLGRQALARRRLAGGTSDEGTDDRFIAVDPRMQQVLETIERVAASPFPVLIEGPSGSGKERCARRIHARSAVRDRPFVAVNAAALPDSLLEAELFGHRKGAFTGAARERAGIFEQARGGTVFLDEVASMSPAFQAKLLRVLEDKAVRPLGADRELPVAFRLIAASNRELAPLVREGAFRDDLFYRLCVVSVRLPPLSARARDIPALAAFFLEEAARACLPPGAAWPRLSPAALDELCAQPWPGNVRELQNAVQRAVVSCRGTWIQPHDLGLTGELGLTPATDPRDQTSYDGAKRAAVERFQRAFVRRALARAGGNVSQAARSCGLTRAALQKILRTLAIDREEFAS